MTKLGTSVVLIVAVLFALSALPLRLAAQEEPSLYDRLGGQDAIAAVVDEMLKNVVADRRINRFFAEADHLTRLRSLLIEQICQATGGPCTYSGRSMQDAHRGLGISDADFAALVEDLVRALDALGVPAREKNELLALLAPMRADIVEVTATPTVTATATGTARPQAPPTSAPTKPPATAVPTAPPPKPTPMSPGFIRYGPLGF